MRHDYVFDSGSLGQLAAGNARLKALIDRITREKGRAVVPAIVLAECCGDSRYDARYHRVLTAMGGANDCVIPIGVTIAMRAGGILRTAEMRATIDAIIVAVAESLGAATNVVTADANDIARLTASANVKLRVIHTV